MSWKIQSHSTEPEDLLIEESLFFTGNGYLGVRGNLEEGLSSLSKTIRGTYINGFYDIVPITYGEKQFGFPDSQQRLLNIIDAQTLEIWIGKENKMEKFSLTNGKVLSYERVLHLDDGYTERKVHWKSTYGDEVIITFKRLTSFTTKELFFQYITLEPISGSIPIKIISTLNGNVTNFTDPTDPRVSSGNAKRLKVEKLAQLTDGDFIQLKTFASNLCTAALSTICISAKNTTYSSQIGGECISTTASFLLTKKEHINKQTYYTDSRHETNLMERLIKIKNELGSLTFHSILNEQKNYLRNFWRNTDVTITDNDSIQEAVRFNLFHILQSAGTDSMSSISAKGLSGEGYEGHYFWDTEIYLLPVLTLTNPDIAKQLLLYRYSILDDAKARAKEMGHKRGALYPWRTISGTECSAYYPAGTAQYHISADIAHSYIQYYLATDDLDFIKLAGVEVLVETARLWLEVGHYYNDAFHIDTVTGPDEYTCIVNNNYYTNVMAKQNLRWAVKVCHLIQQNDELYWNKLKVNLAISDKELHEFQRASDWMYVQIDEVLQINPQDDTFLQKQKWDFKNTPKEHYPLLLHYHPLTIYRHQVCKQADTVLAHLLVEDEQTDNIIKNSYHYYEQVTTHDSSLSSCIFGIMAARVGQLDRAYDYFLQSARLDLDDTHGNTKDGLHMANMGGTWMGIVVGFAGMRVKETGLHFRPQIPKEWEEYTFQLQYKHRLLHFKVTKEAFQVNLIKGDTLSLYVWGEKIKVLNKHTFALT